jgi:hypothetical protein
MMAATRAQLGVTAGVGRNERRRRVGVVVDGEQQGKVSLAAPRPYRAERRPAWSAETRSTRTFCERGLLRRCQVAR